jgi:endonuclease YncB( thermonuclease family)
MRFRLAGPALLLAVLLWSPRPAMPTDPLAGPITAEVVRVIDGDTLVVRARIWLNQEIETVVRVEGVDTPELHSRCPAERAKAEAARDFTEQLVGGRTILLRRIQYDKYGGRIRAEVEGLDDTRLADQLIAGAYGRPYRGGARRAWCE